MHFPYAASHSPDIGSPTLRTIVLKRDYDATVKLSYCCYCSMPKDDRFLEAAYIIPVSISDRLGIPIPMYIASCINFCFNSITLCKECHTSFYLALISISKDLKCLKYNAESKSYHHDGFSYVRTPPNGTEEFLAFPSQAPFSNIWTWREKWCQLYQNKNVLNRFVASPTTGNSPNQNGK